MVGLPSCEDECNQDDIEVRIFTSQEWRRLLFLHPLFFGTMSSNSRHERGASKGGFKFLRPPEKGSLLGGFKGG